MGRLGGWISDRVNDVPLVRYLALPIALLCLIHLLCVGSLFQGCTIRQRRKHDKV